MPQIVGARTTATEKGQEMDRATVERAEQIRVGRERLLKLRVSAGSGVSAAPGIGAGAADEKAQIGDDISDAEALLAAARHETALAVQQAKMAWRTALICAFCVAFGIGAGAWAGVKVVRKINRDTVATVKGVWRTHLNSSGAGARYSGEAQPVVQDGTIYIVTGADDVFAGGLDLVGPARSPGQMEKHYAPRTPAIPFCNASSPTTIQSGRAAPLESSGMRSTARMPAGPVAPIAPTNALSLPARG